MGTLFSASVTGFVGGEVSVREVGEQQTLWVRVNCWNNLATVAHSYLKAGSLVQIQASWMRASAYIDREGNPQASLDINADRLILLDRVNSEDRNIPEITF